MKNKIVKRIVLGVALILALMVLIGMFWNLNGELEEIVFFWYITQILIAPAYFYDYQSVKI